MADDRPAKQTIRRLWVELFQEVKPAQKGDRPTYLTLPGAEARDIRALIDARALATTETGALTPESSKHVVAIEASSAAELLLRQALPGLDVEKGTVAQLLGGKSNLRYPTAKQLRATRATIINLDLNQSLHAERDADGNLILDVVQQAAKLALIHAEPPRERWYLLLTLNASIDWAPDASNLVVEYLRANIAESEGYARHFRHLFDDVQRDALAGHDAVDFHAWSNVDRQKLLLALVPKRIAFETHKQGWLVNVRYSIRYGGGGTQAPMTSWILEFEPDSRSSLSNDVLYRESIAKCLSTTVEISDSGDLAVEPHDNGD